MSCSNLSRKLCVLTTNHTVSCRYLKMFFIKLRKLPSSTSSPRAFIMNGIGFCQMLQLCGNRCGSSFMTGFESLGGPVTLDCELHQFFQFFFSPLQVEMDG